MICDGDRRFLEHYLIRFRTGLTVLSVCLAVIVLIAEPADARDLGQDEARIARCIHQVAGGREWLEKTLWGLRDQEAGWLGAEVRNTNGSHDLGPLQVNSGWVPRIAGLVSRPQADVRLWLTFDPCFNAEAARWIFLSALHTTGAFWSAVGTYHSPTAWRQRRYAVSVARHMQRRFGLEVFAPQHALRDAASVGIVGANAQAINPVSVNTDVVGKRSIVVRGFGIVQGLHN